MPGSVIESLFWGFVASLPLIVGALFALFFTVSRSVVATIMAFGSGVLVAALSFSLVEEAFKLTNDVFPVIIGFVFGGISYTTANYLLNRKSSGKTKGNNKPEGEGLTLLIGSVMDNIPENIVLGISFVTGGTVSIVLIAAIFISNFPEGLASSHAMRSSGKRRRYVIIVWIIAVIIGTTSAGLGYSFLYRSSPAIIGTTTSFAAGAILAMLAESMIPAAFAQGGSKIGLCGRYIGNKHYPIKRAN